MLLITQRFVFNLDNVKWVNIYDSAHIRIVYNNGDSQVFNISFEEFTKELNSKHVI